MRPLPAASPAAPGRSLGRSWTQARAYLDPGERAGRRRGPAGGDRRPAANASRRHAAPTDAVVASDTHREGGRGGPAETGVLDIQSPSTCGNVCTGGAASPKPAPAAKAATSRRLSGGARRFALRVTPRRETRSPRASARALACVSLAGPCPLARARSSAPMPRPARATKQPPAGATAGTELSVPCPLDTLPPFFTTPQPPRLGSSVLRLPPHRPFSPIPSLPVSFVPASRSPSLLLLSFPPNSSSSAFLSLSCK